MRPILLLVALCAVTLESAFAIEVLATFMSDVGSERQQSRSALINQGPEGLKAALEFAVAYPLKDPLYYRMTTQVNVVVRDIISAQWNAGRGDISNLRALIDDASFNFLIDSIAASDQVTREIAAQSLIILNDSRAPRALKLKSQSGQSPEVNGLIYKILSLY